MKLMLFIFLITLSYHNSEAQVSTKTAIFAREFSKEIALYGAKYFVLNSVLGASSEAVRFEIDPLSAASSGELTSLVYKCESKGKKGLVFGFYGNYFNSSGVKYQGFAFKDEPEDRALALFDTIQKALDLHSGYLNENKDYNNIFFEFDEMTFLIYDSGLTTRIRVFWKEFDSEWDMIAYRRTKRRLINKLTD